MLEDGRKTNTKTQVRIHGDTGRINKEGKPIIHLPSLKTLILTNIYDTFWNMKCSVHKCCGKALRVGDIVKIEGEDIMVVEPGIAILGAYVWVDGVRCCKVALTRCLPRHIGMVANTYGVVVQVSRKPTQEERKKEKGLRPFRRRDERLG